MCTAPAISEDGEKQSARSMPSPANARSATRGGGGDTGNVSSAYFEDTEVFREFRLPGSRYFCLKKREECGPFDAEIGSKTHPTLPLLHEQDSSLPKERGY